MDRQENLARLDFGIFQGHQHPLQTPVDLDIAYLCSFDATGLSVSGVATNSTTYTYGFKQCHSLALWEDTWLNHTTPFSGSGTEEDPYIIASAENLAYLSKQVYDGNASYINQYFKQTANIDLRQYNWQPIGVETDRANTGAYHYFGGSYDGNGFYYFKPSHTIWHDRCLFYPRTVWNYSHIRFFNSSKYQFVKCGYQR